MRRLQLTCATVLLAASQARAQSSWSPIFGIKAGTLGAGPELSLRVPDEPFGVRLAVDGLGFTDGDLVTTRFRHDEPSYAYDTTLRLGGTVRLLNGGLTADYYPFGHGFRLSAGVILNGNQVQATGIPQGTTRIGSTVANGPAPGSARARATFNLAAPLVGVGYMTAIGPHLRFSVDIGAMYEGNPHLSYALSGPITALPSVPVDAERARQHLQHEIDEPVYPVVMVGLGWQL